jgi:ribosomal protein S27E
MTPRDEARFYDRLADYLDPDNAPQVVTIARRAAMRRDFVLVKCQTCNGAGEWDEGPLSSIISSSHEPPDYRHVICPDCKGGGQIYVDAWEVERDDDLREREQ